MSKILLTADSIREALSDLGFQNLDMGLDENEIRNISSIRLRNTDGLDELGYFTELENLVIGSGDHDVQQAVSKHAVIPYLPQLKSLLIREMKGLETVDLHNCISLEKLCIDSLRDLKRIIGLSDLKNLSYISVYNCTPEDVSEIKRYMNQKSDSAVFVDLQLLPLFCSMDKKSMSEDFFLFETGIFSEPVSLNFEQGLELYHFIENVFMNLFHDDMTDVEKILCLYRWICREFRFDSQLYVKRSISSSGQKMIEKMDSIKDVSASSYYLMKNKASGCEGFISFLLLALRMLGFVAAPVMCCIPNEFNRIENGYTSYTDRRKCNHIILRISTEDGWVYLDPVMDSIYPESDTAEPFRTRKGILKKYSLDSDEEMVRSVSQSLLASSYHLLHFIQAESSAEIEMASTKEEKHDDNDFGAFVSRHRKNQQEKEEENEPVEGSTTLISDPGHAYLLDDSGKVLAEISEERFSIGRLKTNDLSFSKNTNVTRVHCYIEYEDGKYYLTDPGSTNGTRINGRKVRKGEKVRSEIHDRDEISVADEKLIFKKE